MNIYIFMSTLPAGYFMKSVMSDLRFFDLLFQNWMENPKNGSENKKWAVFYRDLQKFDQILASSVKFWDNLNACKLLN